MCVCVCVCTAMRVCGGRKLLTHYKKLSPISFSHTNSLIKQTKLILYDVSSWLKINVTKINNLSQIISSL